MKNDMNDDTNDIDMNGIHDNMKIIYIAVPL